MESYLAVEEGGLRQGRHSGVQMLALWLVEVATSTNHRANIWIKLTGNSDPDIGVNYKSS